MIHNSILPESQFQNSTFCLFSDVNVSFRNAVKSEKNEGLIDFVTGLSIESVADFF